MSENERVRRPSIPAALTACAVIATCIAGAYGSSFLDPHTRSAASVPAPSHDAAEVAARMRASGTKTFTRYLSDETTFLNREWTPLKETEAGKSDALFVTFEGSNGTSWKIFSGPGVDNAGSAQQACAPEAIKCAVSNRGEAVVYESVFAMIAMPVEEYGPGKFGVISNKAELEKANLDGLKFELNSRAFYPDGTMVSVTETQSQPESKDSATVFQSSSDDLSVIAADPNLRYAHQ